MDHTDRLPSVRDDLVSKIDHATVDHVFANLRRTKHLVEPLAKAFYDHTATWLRSQEDPALVTLGETPWEDAEIVEVGTQDRWRDLAVVALTTVFLNDWTICPLHETVDAAANWAASDYAVGLAQSAVDALALTKTHRRI